MRLIVEYVRSVYTHWRGFCLGMVPFLVVLIASKITVDGKTLDVPTWLWVLLGLMGLLIAQFLSWREEREKRTTAETDLKAIREAQTVALSMVDAKTFLNPSEPEKSRIDPSVIFHNYGPTAVRFEVISASVELDGRTVAPPLALPMEGTIMPGADAEFGLGVISNIDIRQPALHGHLQMALRYGPPAVSPTRQLELSAHLHMLTRDPGDTVNYCEYAGLEAHDNLIEVEDE